MAITFPIPLDFVKVTAIFTATVAHEVNSHQLLWKCYPNYVLWPSKIIVICMEIFNVCTSYTILPLTRTFQVASINSHVYFYTKFHVSYYFPYSLYTCVVLRDWTVVPFVVFSNLSAMTVLYLFCMYCILYTDTRRIRKLFITCRYKYPSKYHILLVLFTKWNRVECMWKVRRLQCYEICFVSSFNFK